MSDLPPVATLLPHGPGMVLLDRLAAHGADWARAEVTIRRDARFADAAGVPGWVGLEYMAQTLAAFEGLLRAQAGKPVQVGLLLGCRSYRCDAPCFAHGSAVTVDARLLLRGADGVTAWACELRADGRLVAQADIKAYQPDDIGPFLDALYAEAA